MTAFSLGTVWEETTAFLRRESGLLIPVALAIYGPAQIMLDFGLSSAMAMRGMVQPALTPQALLVLPGALLLLLGNLAVTLIVLSPGISVGEALRAAAKRLPVALGAMLLLFVAVSTVMLAIVIAATVGAVAFGADPRSPAIAGQLMVLLMIPIGVLWIRLLLLPAVVACEAVGPAEAVRRAWALGKDNLLRLIGVWVILLFLSIVVAMIEMVVVGSLAQLLQLATGDGQLSAILQAIVSAAMEGLLSMGFAVYLAHIYRRVVSS